MEMHKKATQRVKHEEKKAQKEIGGGLTAAMNAALAPAGGSGAAASSSAAAPASGLRPPGSFDFGAVLKMPPPPPVPGGLPVFGGLPPPLPPFSMGAPKEEMPEGYTDYQQSIYRLKKLEQEEERERGFRELLDAQLRAQEQSRQQEQARAAEAVP